MTKRVLSLLLTLVMVLSLCVPALAADDGFVAEAPADVIEEAPAAPVEPEAPEAEEPAEEPVVDEPIAEEADAPEIAAVMEEEDLPLLVKLGVVSKEAHWYLEDAVAAAEALMPDVEAGVYRQKDFQGVNPNQGAINWAEYDPEKDDAFEDATKDFLDAYEKAVDFLAAVDGKEVEYDVTTTSVNNMANQLSAFLPSTVRPYNARQNSVGNTQELVKTGAGNYMSYTQVSCLIRWNAYASYSTRVGSSPLSDLKMTNQLTASTDVTTGTWAKAYKADYLTALQAAIDAWLSYPTSGQTYAEYKALATAVINALTKEAVASRPDASDMPALDSALSAAQSALDNDYKAADYVREVTNTSLNNAITIARGLKNQNVGLNGFATTATFFDYNASVEELTSAVVKKSDTLKVEDWIFNPDGNGGNGAVTLILSVDKIAKTISGDGNTYHVAFKYGDYWYNGAAANNHGNKTTPTYTDLISSTFDATDTTKYPNKWLNKSVAVPAPFGLDANDNPKAKWVSGDVIYVYLYGDDGSVKEYSFACTPITLGIEYTGPVIKKATVKDYPTTVTVTAYDADHKLTTSNMPTTLRGTATASGLNIEVELSDVMGTYTQYKLDVIGSNDKLVAEVTSINGTNHTFSSVNDEYMVAGDDVDVQLKVSTRGTNKDDYIPQSTVSLSVKPLSTWNQVSTIEKWLKAAGELVPSDYDKVKNNRKDVKTVSEAFSVINADISAIRSDLTSATVANSAYNQNKVINTLADLVEVCQYLQKKAADLTTMNALLSQAEKLLAETDKEYTYDSYYPLRDLFKDADKPTSSSLQSEVDEYVADLQAAITAMAKEGAVDKAPLTAAIAKADALKEADYTASSWTAAKPAIDAAVAAAKVVLDNAKATQAQVTNAVNAIEAAIATLEKVVPDEPEILPPASGTGWRYVPETGEYYFFKNGKLVSNYWVGKIDGASAWDNNWYYVGSDGKLFTGMAYIDDLHGGYGWYFLQPTDKNGEIGKMLTGWQYVGVQNGTDYGTCYFSAKNGSAGKCTYSTTLGDWNGATWVK